MCLIKTHKFPKISTKPITVYKALRVNRHGEYFTPYRDIKVNMGETIKAKKSWLREFSGIVIEGGGVHAYTTYEIADFRKPHTPYSIIVEAIIPPYTPYWIGLNGEIAASKIKIVKEL